MFVLGLRAIRTEVEDSARAPGHRAIVILIPCYGLRHPSVTEGRHNCTNKDHKQEG